MHKKLFICTVLAAASAAAFASGRTDSKLAKDYFELGQAFAEVSKYEKAIEYYQKAAADPAHKNAAEYNLARVYTLQNDWGNALKLLEKQYKTAPDNSMICNAFAYTLAASGNAERAANLYKAIYDKDKYNPEAAFNYVRILIAAKKYQEGLTFLESIKTDFPENTEKRIYDELEEKLHKLLEPPKDEAKESSKTDSAAANGESAQEPIGSKTDDAEKSGRAIPEKKAGNADQKNPPQMDGGSTAQPSQNSAAAKTGAVSPQATEKAPTDSAATQKK
ncbi:MAG: tetratricopeptide repeat protein [Treponema sp.]